MGFVKFVLAMLLFGAMATAAIGLIVLLFLLWAHGLWWLAALALAILGAWYWGTMAYRGERRNDFGV